MPFEDREEPARQLARRLDRNRGAHPLVLAIPRGAAPMGKVVADALGGDLDVVLVRKLRAPDNPELAIGSIDEKGSVYLDPDLRGYWTEAYLEREQREQLRTLEARRALYGASRPADDPAGRTVIVIDDGLATGSTMIAALRALRARRPARLIAAVAVAPAETVERIRGEADEVVCLETPPVFLAIGLHFRDFSQVEDEEVVRILREMRQHRPQVASRSSGASATS
jgi:predicted phosphoribosyltransferase